MLALTACLLVMAGNSRSHTFQAGSINNLHDFAAVTASYAADKNDTYWSFTWRTGDTNRSHFPDINEALPSATYFDPAALQAVDIARRRAEPGLPIITGWASSVQYSHWVLCDYLDQPLTLPFAISPGDRFRRMWSEDIERFRNNGFGPLQPDPTGGGMRNPYSSSYRSGPAFWSADYATPTHMAVEWNGSTNFFYR
jgi:hypothetical protein